MFERVPGGSYRAPVSINGLDDPFVIKNLDAAIRAQVEEEIEVLDLASEAIRSRGRPRGRAEPGLLWQRSQ